MSKKSEKIDNRNSIRIESGSRNKRFKAQYLFLLVLLLPLTNSKKKQLVTYMHQKLLNTKNYKKKKKTDFYPSATASSSASKAFALVADKQANKRGSIILVQ